MRNPITVLNTLSKETIKPNYKFKRIYRNFYNEEFFYIAYQKLSKNNGNLTQGVNDKTIDNMSIQRIQNLIIRLKDYSYQPNPVKRVYIQKKNGKLRPLGIPTFEDKLVQEVLRMILEAIYEPNFSDNSHGFRPNKSCHSAINQISMWNGIKWYIEGDITGCFDNIDHHILINTIREKIEDEHFIALIWKFLRAGYMEEWKYNNTYSGTPQGGIISPLLANIYLDKFDKYMNEYIEKFNKGKKRKRNKEYKSVEFQISKNKKFIINKRGKLDNSNHPIHDLNEEEIKTLKKKVKELCKIQRTIPSLDEFDESFKRLTYTRYADDFLIGVIGSKEDCINIKNDIAQFMKNKLKLELSKEKTLITNSSNFVRFLGYEITIHRKQIAKKNSKGVIQRTLNGKPSLYIPSDVWKKKLIEYKALKIEYINGKEVWKPFPRVSLINFDELEIINRYNAEIRGLYNYYKLAHNVNVLQKFHHIMKFSFAKTLSTKNRCSVGKTMSRHKIGKDFGVKYTNNKGVTKYVLFYNNGFKRDTSIGKNEDLDNYPYVMKITPIQGRTSLISRLKARKCEYCGAENVELEMHHIKAVKDLKGKTELERLMVSRRRKQIALCKECHLKQRFGKL